MKRTKVAVSLLVAAFFVLAACAQYVKVTVTNATAEPVHDVEIRYTGGSMQIPEIPANAARTVEIRPSGESGLSVRYRHASGAERAKDADVYLERDYSGTVAVEIRSDKEITVSSNAHPR